MTETHRKEKSRGFADFGIPIGSTLIYKKDPNVTVKTLDDKNKVEYQGKLYSISTLAKQLVGSPVSGYLYFKYEGKTLRSLVKAKYEPAEIPTVTMEADKSKSGQDIDPLAGEIEVDSAEFAANKAAVGE